jgi:hypothetical protein
MANELSTAGIKFWYLISDIADEPPLAAAWNLLGGVKATPDYDSSPNMLQVTDLSDTNYHRYIPGLRALNEPWELSANLTQANIDNWNSIISQFENRSPNQVCWFTFSVPGISVAPYLYGIPYAIGVPAMEVDSVLEVSFKIVPNKILDTWFPKIEGNNQFTTSAGITVPPDGAVYTIGSAITGTATTGATVTLYVDGAEAPPTAVAANGIFSITPASDIAEGIHYLRIKQTVGGNDSPLTEPMLINAVAQSSGQNDSKSK